MAFTERALIACSASLLAFITFYYYWHSKRTKSIEQSTTILTSSNKKTLIESKENGIGTVDCVGDCLAAVNNNNNNIESKHYLKSNGNNQQEPVELKVKEANQNKTITANNCNIIENKLNNSLTSDRNNFNQNQCLPQLNKTNNDTEINFDQNNCCDQSNLEIINENMHLKMHNFTESSSTSNECSTDKNGITTVTNIDADDVVDTKINNKKQSTTLKKKNSSGEMNVELEKAILPNSLKTPKKMMMQSPASAIKGKAEDAIASASASSSSIKIKSSSADDALLTTGNAGGGDDDDDDATTVEENGQKIQCENVDLLNSMAAFNENGTDRIYLEADIVKDEDIQQQRSPSSIKSIKNKMLKKRSGTAVVKNNNINNHHQHNQEKSVIEKSSISDKNSNRKMNDANVGDDCDDYKVFTDNIVDGAGCSGVDGGNDDDGGAGSVENLSAQIIVCNDNPKQQLKRTVSETIMNTSSTTTTVSSGTVDTVPAINNYNSKTPAPVLKQENLSNIQFKQTFAQILSNSNNKNNTATSSNTAANNNNNKTNANSNIIDNNNINNCDPKYKSDSKVMLNSNKNNCSINKNENTTHGDKIVDVGNLKYSSEVDIYQNYPDVMATPTSDEQFDHYSQGSNDSGKGSCVDTVANDLFANSFNMFNVPDDHNIQYNFEIPIDLSGLLIGKKGRFIQPIKKNTNTEIYIHPYNDAFNICCIFGQKLNVMNALNIIRQRLCKFPISYDHVELSPTFELNQSCQLHLPKGVMVEVILSATFNPGKFYVQQPTHATYNQLGHLDLKLKETYSQLNTPIINKPYPGLVCVAPSLDGWYRAMVEQVHECHTKCNVLFVDYGSSLCDLPIACLRQIQLNFMYLPFQASKCLLANIEPADATIGWTTEAIDYFNKLTLNQIIFAKYENSSSDGVPCVELFKTNDNNELINIGVELVNSGHARWQQQS